MKYSIVLSQITALAQLIRVVMSVMLGLSPLAGSRWAGVTHLPAPTTITLFLIGFLTAAGGFALNDIHDRDRDRLVTAKPLARSAISTLTAVGICLTSLVMSLLLSALVGQLWFFVNIAQIVLLLVYSRLKRWSGISANVTTALLCTSGIIFGSLFGTFSMSLLLFLGGAFLLILGREILKDILDIPQDERAGLKTLPTIFGARVSNVVTLLLVLGASSLTVIALPSIGNTIALPIGQWIVLGLLTCVLLQTTIQSHRSLQVALHGSAIAMFGILTLPFLPT